MHLSEATGETATRGLDTLEADCRQYRRSGARFAKWRAALRIGDGLPSEAAVQCNAEDLAQYAAIAQVWAPLQCLCNVSLTATSGRTEHVSYCCIFR